ncbi:MAG: hypothetical protein RBJ76_11915 [Stenomitos frigidus ULC029]
MPSHISLGTWLTRFIRTLKITYSSGLIHLIFTAAIRSTIAPLNLCSSACEMTQKSPSRLRVWLRSIVLSPWKTTHPGGH